MTVAFLDARDRTAWIRNHTPTTKTHYFDCRGTSYPYKILEEPDPDMGKWLYYDTETATFYISGVYKRAVREHLLRMECIRVLWEKDKTHISAVRRALETPKGGCRKKIIAALLAFYSEWADKLRPLPSDDLPDDQKDIMDTTAFLESQS